MAEDRMAVLETVRKAIADGDVDFLREGNLYVSESGAGRVDLLIRTFKLVPLRAGIRTSRQPVCIEVERAHGFTDPITLQGGPGVRIVQQPGTGNRGAVQLVDCPHSSACGVTASWGSLLDVLRF